MQRSHAIALIFTSAVVVGVPAAGCGGSVEIPGGGPGSGSSSGASSSSSSGVISSSSSSSGGRTTSPQCEGLAVPSIAALCPDGSTSVPTYVWSGTKCVLTFPCEHASPPSGSSSGGVVPSPPGPVPSTAPAPTPAPPACNFALPNLCEACSNGETICAHYAIQNGACLVEICPPSMVPPPVPVPLPPSTCAPGATCQQGEGCGSSGTGGNSCSTSCSCDSTGHFQCSQSCPPPSPSGCSAGAACSPGSGCGGGPDSYGCFQNCTCDTYGILECSYMCGFGAADGG